MVRLSDIKGYVKAVEPEVLRFIGEQSRRNGTDGLTSREINKLIRSSRVAKNRQAPGCIAPENHYGPTIRPR